MYNGNLSDALQLAVSVNCLMLLLIITGVYLLFYGRTGKRTFLSGALITVDILMFITAETVIIINGWLFGPEAGRLFHRLEQLPVFLFSATLSYFMYVNFSGSRLRTVFRYLAWIGAGTAVAVFIAGFIAPEMLISLEQPSTTPAVSPGDFGRGHEGSLYRIRDIFLSFYIFAALAYSVYYLFIRKFRKSSLVLMAGILFTIAGGIDDMQYYYSGMNFILDGLRFSRFSLGATVMMIFFLAAVLMEYFKGQHELLEANRSLRITEGRYRLLVEAADEIVFSLDPDLKVISASSKAERIFRLNNEEPVPFASCLYHHDDGSNPDTRFISSRLKTMKEPGQNISFNTYLRDIVTGEPMEYHFRFDCFMAGKMELVGRAWPAAGSKLAEYVVSERLTLSVENYISLVGDIVDRLTDNVGRLLEKEDLMLLKMGLHEMIVNAMEHGNLNVTFDEKTAAQDEGRLFEFLNERRRLPEYKDRKVTIDYFFDDESIIYRITDMGPGFDYTRIMERVKNEVNQKQLTHGRGIIMTRAVFDSVEYNRKGNQVLLVKNIPKEKDDVQSNSV